MNNSHGENKGNNMFPEARGQDLLRVQPISIQPSDQRVHSVNTSHNNPSSRQPAGKALQNMGHILYYTVGLALFQPLMTMEMDKSSNTSSDFLYFAYGSNLLKERLQLNNPSAQFVRTGRLKDYSLRFGHWREDFNGSNSWHGGVATIQPATGEDVWGVIWKMDTSNLISLDKQEGVKWGSYSPMEVTVDTEEGLIVCRTYQMNNFKAYLPSPPYKQVVCLGARQNGLPLEYIKKLDAVETNGYSGPSILDDIVGFKPTGDPQLEPPETTTKKTNPFFKWLFWLS